MKKKERKTVTDSLCNLFSAVEVDEVDLFLL